MAGFVGDDDREAPPSAVSDDDTEVSSGPFVSERDDTIRDVRLRALRGDAPRDVSDHDAASRDVPDHDILSLPAIDDSTAGRWFDGDGGSPKAKLSARTSKNRRGWTFVPLAPFLLLFVGLVVAFAIGIVGVNDFTRAVDRHAASRAELLAVTLSARLAVLPDPARREALDAAVSKGETELLVVTPDARVIHDATFGAPGREQIRQLLSRERGILELRLGRTRFASRPIGEGNDAPRLLVFVAEPLAAPGVSTLVRSLVVLVTLLLVLAAIAAFAVSRDVTRDVDFITQRVRDMTSVRADPASVLVPPRTLDQVGLLTVAFNDLVGRFETAEAAYREDLDRARATDRERAAFLAAVSHELRSPLNAILGFADILMEEVDGPLSPSAREEVEQIRGSGQHLLGLINDLLEFSALESGQLRLSRGRRDLFELASEVVREARGLIGSKPISLRLEGVGPIFARVDGRRVRQVLGNLVNNAIKFTQRGEVVVRMRKEVDVVIISVSDTGSGISEDDRALIFREYKQGRRERRRRRGSGLGLAIAKRIVDLHRGSISVDSAVGEGSVFHVILPVGNLDAAPSQRTSRYRDEMPGGTR